MCSIAPRPINVSGRNLLKHQLIALQCSDKIQDMLGSIHGRLLVIADVDRLQKNRPRYLCRCECGTLVHADHYHLKSGHTSSCGCAKVERLVAMNKTHGRSRTPEYRSWTEARQRCMNPEHAAFHDYGARGIRVCKRWDRFENFLEDMGLRPSPKHSLDRINVDGHYSPSNCRWATSTQQNSNKRKTRLVEFENELVTITQLARKLGLPKSSLRRWIVDRNQSVEDVLRACKDTALLPSARRPGGHTHKT